MILGLVNVDLEATIDRRIIGPAGQEHTVEAAIDTGFNGFLTLPPMLIQQLGLVRIGRGRALMASGGRELFNIYEVAVFGDNQGRTVEAIAADSNPLVGMDLLYGYELSVEVVVGARVIIQRRP